MSWTDGYQADIDYTSGYYGELAPGRMDFALALAGHAPPPRQPLRYLELGFGQGVSACIHAAACPGQFWGADFNPGHAANAQNLARASGTGATFYDDSFAQLAARDSIPEVDYIVLHGIWSWVSPAVQESILEVVRRRLRVGGALYISYNALPGWSGAGPLQHLLAQHAAHVGAAQTVLGRVDAGMAFARQLADVDARYFKQNPVAKSRLDSLAVHDRRYLAHEFYNDSWVPQYFGEVAARMAEAKLGFAGSGATLDQIDAFQLTAAQRELIDGLASPEMRETVRDYCQNTQFRRDLFTRGAPRLPAIDRRDRIYATRLAPTIPLAEMTYSIATSLGEINLKEDIYQPIIEHIWSAAEPPTVGEIAALPALRAWGSVSIIEAVATMIGSNRVHPAQSAAVIAEAAPACARLNTEIIERARAGGDIVYLASPVIGAGAGVGRFEQMFLAARIAGATTPEAWAQHAWTELQRQDQLVLKDGVKLMTAEDNLAELTARATAFADKRLALLRKLGVAT